MNIWQSLPKNYTALAPMEGVTDQIFRQIITKAARPHLFFTEFTNVTSYASEQGRANALDRLKYLPTDPPIIPQIWGTTPDHFTTTAHGLATLGYTAIDINMGCPDRHVVATGGGAALIKSPTLATQIIAATKLAGLPISVKTRLGYTHPSEYTAWLSHLLRHNLAALTIHLRTKKEMSKVPAHHALIPAILALRDQISPTTHIIINGDIKSAPHAAAIWRQHPTINGIMIGRGIFADPYCFETPPTTHTPHDLIALLFYHLDLFDQHHSGSTPRIDTLKRFFKIYINNFPGASTLRANLMNATTTSQVRAIINAFERKENL
jgi:tRNA-dihydrouridine synthase